MIVSVAVPCGVVTVAVTVTPPSPGSAFTSMGGAALAEVVAAVTTNRAPTKERMILLISATFLLQDLPLWLARLLRVAVIRVAVSSDQSRCA
jgi:hypothetical protein